MKIHIVLHAGHITGVYVSGQGRDSLPEIETVTLDREGDSRTVRGYKDEHYGELSDSARLIEHSEWEW